MKKCNNQCKEGQQCSSLNGLLQGDQLLCLPSNFTEQQIVSRETGETCISNQMCQSRICSEDGIYKGNQKVKSFISSGILRRKQTNNQENYLLSQQSSSEGIKEYCSSSGVTYYSSSSFYCPKEYKRYDCTKQDSKFQTNRTQDYNRTKRQLSDVPIGAIVGGSIGGIFFIGAIIFICTRIFAFRQRMREMAEQARTRVTKPKNHKKDHSETHHHHHHHHHYDHNENSQPQMMMPPQMMQNPPMMMPPQNMMMGPQYMMPGQPNMMMGSQQPNLMGQQQMNYPMMGTAQNEHIMGPPPPMMSGPPMMQPQYNFEQPMNPTPL